MDLKKIFRAGEEKDVVEEKEVVGVKSEKPKRVLIVEQRQNDTFACYFTGLTSRQQLLPMLRAAEKKFRMDLNRKAIQMSNESGKLLDKTPPVGA